MNAIQWKVLFCGALRYAIAKRAPRKASPGMRHSRSHRLKSKITNARWFRTELPAQRWSSTGLFPGFIRRSRRDSPRRRTRPAHRFTWKTRLRRMSNLAAFWAMCLPTRSVRPTTRIYFPAAPRFRRRYIPNGGESRNSPISPSYNGTKLSLVTRTDANAADDVGITSGNQALRVSMLNVSQGDGDTSFDRPASLIIKANDFWGVADSRFNTFETVRADPSQYSVSIDVTFLANEIPDTFTRGWTIHSLGIHFQPCRDF